jgi:hypothetical protein
MPLVTSFETNSSPQIKMASVQEPSVMSMLDT